jgi:hypothetical protein
LLAENEISRNKNTNKINLHLLETLKSNLTSVEYEMGLVFQLQIMCTTHYGKIIPLLNKLSTTPRRNMGECKYSAIILDLGSKWG